VKKSLTKRRWSVNLLIGFYCWWQLGTGTVQAQSTQIIINELYPNSNTDEDEWVELYNLSEQTIDLGGFELWDELSLPSKIHSFTAEDKLAGQAFLLVSLHNKLNNSGDAVILKDATGQEIDRLAYPSSTKEKSWSKNPSDLAEVWETIPTKAEINLIPTPTPTPTPVPSASAISTDVNSSSTETVSPAINESAKLSQTSISNTEIDMSRANVLGATSDFVYPLTVLHPKLSYDQPRFSQENLAQVNLAFLAPPAFEKGALSVIMGSLFLLIPGWIYVKNRQKNF